MAILSNETAVEYAKELTIIAMEQKMIVPSSDVTLTAEEIFKCFKTLYENFTDSKSE